MERRTKIILGIGAGAVILSGGSLLYYYKVRPGTTIPANASGFTMQTPTVSAGGSSVAVSIMNQGTTPASTTVAGTVASGGQTIATYGPVNTQTIQPGASQTVNLTLQATIPATYAGQTLTVQLALPDGTTATATFTAQGAAGFSLTAANILNSPVPIGQVASANVQVQNTGSGPGTATVSGVITLNGQQIGVFSARTLALQPGQTQTVNLQSAIGMPQSLTGDTLDADFAVA